MTAARQLHVGKCRPADRFASAVFSVLSVRGCRTATVSDIPGPRSLPLIGTSWKYFPIIGEYDVSHLDEVGKKKLFRYGKVVLERVAGMRAVNLFSPADIQAVYSAEGKYPRRRSHLALQHYRHQRPLLYNSGGLFPSNGEEWWRLRQAFQQPVSPLSETRQFLPVADRITRNFLSRFIGHGTSVDDFLPVVSRLNLQLTWAALFGERFVSAVSDSVLADLLVQAAETCNESILTTDNTYFIWKYVKTRAYVQFEQSMQLIEKIAIDSINDFKSSEALNRNQSIVSKFLELPGVDEKDLLGMVIDLLLGGVDTTSYTSCMLLHKISQNTGCQEKLHREACSLLPTEQDEITSQILSSSSYTRAVLKETFRLNPISIGTSRFLDQDVTLPSGYTLTKGTLVLTQNLTACRLEENFPRALDFLPERWMQGEELYQGRRHPYLLLPFGHGPRACIARRRAEQNLLVFILRIWRKYRVEWTGEKALGIVTPLINKPDGPVALRFTAIS